MGSLEIYTSKKPTSESKSIAPIVNHCQFLRTYFVAHDEIRIEQSEKKMLKSEKVVRTQIFTEKACFAVDYLPSPHVIKSNLLYRILRTFALGECRIPPKPGI